MKNYEREDYDDMENKEIFEEKKGKERVPNKMNIEEEDEIKESEKKEYEEEDEELYPSCSEIVWKLGVESTMKEKILKALENKKDETHSTYMDDFPDKFLGIMINSLKEEQGYGDIRLKMVSNDNGENWGFIEEGFKLAKLCLDKKMDKKEAQEKLEKLFDEGEEEEEDEELYPSC